MNSNTHHYQIPTEPGRFRALALATLVHLMLLVFLWIGVSWQSDTPVAVEAEIWNPVAREAAPPLPPPPAPAPMPVSPKPVAVVEPPKPVVEPEPVKAKFPDPDIALEKEKKRKLEKEDADRLKKEKLAEKNALEEDQKRKKQIEAQEKAQEKKEQAELEKMKLAEEKKQKEEAAAEEKRKLADEQRKLAEEQQRKQEEAAADQRARKRREDDLRRQLGGDGLAGDAEKSQGQRSDGGYARIVAGLIKSHTILPQNDISGNPPVEFLIELLPDGGLRGEPKMTKSSGIPAFDLAVRRAIEKSVPFPADKATGKVPSSISIYHRPKDSENR